jgi:hypothetical protein
MRKEMFMQGAFMGFMLGALYMAISVHVLQAQDIKPARAPQGAERAVVAAVIIAESGGHGRKGMSAVYEVVFERASRQRTSCYAEVTRDKQFSCLNGKKPIRVRTASLVQRMSKHREYKWVHDELLKWVPITNHTGGYPGERCTHYHAEKVKDPETGKLVDFVPYWAEGKKPARTFGGHHWYNNVK